MTRDQSKQAFGSSLRIRIGGWFEANATGWGIVIVPLVLAGLILAAYALQT